MQINKVCAVCGIEYQVPHWRGSSKYCSRACSDKSKYSKPETVCTNCGKDFHMKKSQKIRYGRELGYFCSAVCLSEKKSEGYLGKRNPNYRGRTTDCDGYLLRDCEVSRTLSKNVKRLHQAVCCEQLGVDCIPDGYVCHHRDCDPLNNTVDNLCLITPSDHRWIHKQYGSATLWAMMQGKISIEDLVSWANDQGRAARLLRSSVRNQSIVDGVVIETTKENKV